MPSYNYNLRADQCPVPISPESVTQLNVQDATPVQAESTAVSQVTGVSETINKIAVRTDLSGRFGGGAYGVVRGLALSQSVAGSLDISAGQALLDGIREKKTAATAVLTSSQNNWVFLLRSGVVQIVTGATAPANPAAVCCYLGRCVVDGGGNVTDFDLSGVVWIQGANAYRRTADLRTPRDTNTLPASLALTTFTQAGPYLWMGGSYEPAGASSILSGVVCYRGAVVTHEGETVWLT